MTMRARKACGLVSKSSASFEPRTPHMKPHGPPCFATFKCSIIAFVTTRHLAISAQMPLRPSMPTPHEQAGNLLHPAAALRNNRNTLPNLAVGQRELPSSLAADQRLAPAPPGFLLLIGTLISYPVIHFFQLFYQYL